MIHTVFKSIHQYCVNICMTSISVKPPVTNFISLSTWTTSKEVINRNLTCTYSMVVNRHQGWLQPLYNFAASGLVNIGLKSVAVVSRCSLNKNACRKPPFWQLYYNCSTVTHCFISVQYRRNIKITDYKSFLHFPSLTRFLSAIFANKCLTWIGKVILTITREDTPIVGLRSFHAKQFVSV